MKKIMAMCMIIVVVLSFSACKSANEKAIVGTWKVVDTETETEYGLGLEFSKDGKLRYGLTEDVFKGLAEGEDVDEAMAGLDALMSIEYKIKSDTEMEITAKALLGLAKESDTVEYSLDGDSLVFDGAKYTRVK